MDWSIWIMFVLTEGALNLSPGPAVLFVVSQGLRCGSAGAPSGAIVLCCSGEVSVGVSAAGTPHGRAGVEACDALSDR